MTIVIWRGLTYKTDDLDGALTRGVCRLNGHVGGAYVHGANVESWS